jgi:FkbM family methyltransferase
MLLNLSLYELSTWPRMTLEAAIRRRVQTAYLGNGVVLARVLGQHKMFLRSADRGFACNVMLDGYWEMWLTQFLAQRLRPGMTVIDVGANFGYYTLLMGEAVGAAGHVLAVEPNPEASALLQESVNLAGHWSRTRVAPQALGASAGLAWLYAPDGEPKNASLVGQPGRAGGTTIEVAMLTLDELALGYSKVDLVKIDAEGGEQGIVAGMQQLIARDRPLIVLEFNATRYSEPGAFLDSLLAYYGTAVELRPTGDIVPLDRASVLDQTSYEDRLLVFE